MRRLQVFTIKWKPVHVAVESVFTIPWKHCSPSRGIRNEGRLREATLEMQDDIVAFDVHLAVMHQAGHQTARIDAEIERGQVLGFAQIQWVRYPVNALEI